MNVGERETFEDTLRRLSYERILPRETADLFHALRKFGNAAVHETRGTHAEALSGLRFARQLGIWFHRTYGKKPDFKPGPFIPPPEPVDTSAQHLAEIAALQAKLEAARREADEHARARETAEERLKREAEERAIWEQLAHEAEAEKIRPLPSMARPSMARPSISRSATLFDLELDEAQVAVRLQEIQAAAEQSSKSQKLDLITRSEEAATKIDLDEAETRALIDHQLRDSEWEADTQRLRHSQGKTALSRCKKLEDHRQKVRHADPTAIGLSSQPKCFAPRVGDDIIALG